MQAVLQQQQQQPMNNHKVPTPFFDITSYTSPATHVREYRHGVVDAAEGLVIVAKQYVPRTERSPQQGDPTFIACGGIGIMKELYEPLFEDVTRRLATRNVFPRAFWIADATCVGDSAVLNKSNLTTDQNWFDHSRDLLLMVSHFRDLMPKPLVGIGHSMGASQLVFLANFHPSLFHTILFIEPAIHMGMDNPTRLMQAKAMTRRREIWPTHAEAVEAVRTNPFYKPWDKRVVELLINHNFTHVDDGSETVITKTPRSMEVALMLRPNLHGVGRQGLEKMTTADRLTHPDVDPEVTHLSPFYRPEPMAAMQMMKSLRPSACFIMGGKSKYSTDETRKMRLELTGNGAGGSGGAKLGRVVEHVLPKGEHYIMFDRDLLPLVADKASDWLVSEMQRWKEEQQRDHEWNCKSLKEKQDTHPVVVEAMKDWHPKKNPDIDMIVKSKL